MPRAPFQVVVLPFRRAPARRVEYALFRRADDGVWQPVAGGGEDGETPEHAARREAWEEARIPPGTRLHRLQAMDMIPATAIRDRRHWSRDVIVIPQHAFAADVGETGIVLSREHTEQRWLGYRAARDLLRYDSNRTALWELDVRLRTRRLPPPV
jgi:dATP pyrophosphohydrolase